MHMHMQMQVLAHEEGLSHVGAWDQRMKKPVSQLNGGPLFFCK